MIEEYTSILTFSTVGFVLFSIIIIVVQFSIHLTKRDIVKYIEETGISERRLFSALFLLKISRRSMFFIIISLLYVFASITSLIGILNLKNKFFIILSDEAIITCSLYLSLAPTVAFAGVLMVCVFASFMEARILNNTLNWLRER
jgi:hypothetical protein